LNNYFTVKNGILSFGDRISSPVSGTLQIVTATDATIKDIEKQRKGYHVEYESIKIFYDIKRESFMIEIPKDYYSLNDGRINIINYFTKNIMNNLKLPLSGLTSVPPEPKPEPEQVKKPEPEVEGIIKKKYIIKGSLFGSQWNPKRKRKGKV
jgi:hypothetical protein